MDRPFVSYKRSISTAACLRYRRYCVSGPCPLKASSKRRKSEPSSILPPTGRSTCLTFSPNFTAAGRICYSRRRARNRTAPCSAWASPTSHWNFITRLSRKRLRSPLSTPPCIGRWPALRSPITKRTLSVVESAENRDVLTLACDLTRAVASLLPVTDSLAVCWLNGPALNSAESFSSTAREMFGTGLYPLKLWVAVGWDAQAGALQTNGMAQFAAPEICLAQQPDAAPLMVNYLFQVAQSALTSHHQIAHGETMDSPHGKLKIKKSSVHGKSVLILEPDNGK